MGSQSHHYYAALRRRRYIEQRQNAPSVTAKVAPLRPTVIPTPLKIPATPIVKPKQKQTVTPTITPARPTVTVATPRVSAPVNTPSLPSFSLGTPVSSVVPSSTLGPPLPSATSTRPPSATHQAITPPATSSKSLAGSTPTTSSSVSGGVSTGAVVGGIIGGFAVLGLIGAAIFLFLRRAKEKKERNEKAFDASKFRRSAIVLDDPTEKRSRSQPPTATEQLAHQYGSSPVPSPYSPSGSLRCPVDQAYSGSSYTSSHPYGLAYSGAAHGVQTAYGQHSLPPNVYTAYRNPHGYPPQQQYQSDTRQHDTYLGPLSSSVYQPESPDAGQDNLVLPNPFPASPSPDIETTSRHYPSNASPTSITRAFPQSAPSAPNQRSMRDTDAPPAYEATSKLAKYKPDVKRKIMPSESNSSSGTATSNTPGSTSHAASTSSPVSTSIAGHSNCSLTCDKSLPSRPVSVATVYDVNDAYGGM